ncbi:cytokine receptor-like factor 2 isoform X2 [Paroedura picta]
MNLNNEQITVSWNAPENFPDRNMTMFYRFDKEWKQCPQYILDQEYNTGCQFKPGVGDLHIFINDSAGKGPNYNDEESIKTFFKPKPPENVTYHWEYDKVTVQCSPPGPPDCFGLELQYKSILDQEWKSREETYCKVEVHGLDPEKCYVFRVRLEAKNCNKVPYFSEWGSETFWKNGTSIDSCNTDPESNIMILLISIMATVLVLFALLMLVCRMQRIRKSIMPVIPDPKHMYSNLFSDHNGNFQDWISTTENVLVHAKVEDETKACVIEEQEYENKQAEKVDAQENLP